MNNMSLGNGSIPNRLVATVRIIAEAWHDLRETWGPRVARSSYDANAAEVRVSDQAYLHPIGYSLEMWEAMGRSGFGGTEGRQMSSANFWLPGGTKCVPPVPRSLRPPQNYQ
jgi:hypothetical protein